MALTNAQKQSAHRKRVADRIKRYEAALQEIAGIWAPSDDSYAHHAAKIAQTAIESK